LRAATTRIAPAARRGAGAVPAAISATASDDAKTQAVMLDRYEEDGRRERGGGGGRRVPPCFSLCLIQHSAHRHSTMKVPSAAGRRERRQPNFELISV
jgi:hypothetical protein